MTPSRIQLSEFERRQSVRPTLPEWPDYSAFTKRWLIVKRAFDVIGSSAMLLLLSPLLLAVSLAIKITSPGPVLFKSRRRGYYGRSFEVLKFRTMEHESHVRRQDLMGHDKPDRLLFKLKHDPRVTWLGKWLRKYSLDELPQLFNVLSGDMSLIGPRPLLKEDFEGAGTPSPLFRQWVRERHRLRPGITGLWQVSGRNDLNFEQSMEMDLRYVGGWSPKLDLMILLKTPLAVLAGKGAY